MKLLASLLPLYAVTACAAAQGVPSAASPQHSAAAEQTPLAPAYTIRAGTQLVVLDVTVRDKHGKPVHGLPQSAFTLTEGGKPQQVRNFEEHVALTPSQLAALPARPALPPGQFTNFVATPQTGALNVILIDVLNTAVANQMYMRTQLREYLKRARPDSRTAIFALNNHLVQLQGFTSNPATLLAALDAEGKPKTGVFRDDLNGGLYNSDSNSTAGGFLAQNAGMQSVMLDPAIAAYEEPIDDFQQQMRAYLTLDGLNDLGRTLAQIPGRKNLIWFAGDFPPEFFPSDHLQSSMFNATAALEDEFRDTVNLLSRAQVAVYPIDAQGLRADQANTADKSNGRYADKQFSARAIGADTQAEFTLRASEHLSMQQIAEDTGGNAVENSNDLAAGAADAIADGSNYYTISYTPSGESSAEGFRHISVKVGDGSYKLSYRRGYYTEHIRRVALAGKTAVPAAASPLEQALLPGSPQPAEILLRVSVAPVDGPAQPTVFAGNLLNSHPKKPVSGPFRTFQVSTAASVRNMSFTHGADKIIHTAVDVVTNIYDQSGNLINVQANTLHGEYAPQELPELLRSGLEFEQRVSVPEKGEYFLRVAVHDRTGGHIGAVEIPVEAVAGLPPVADAKALPATVAPSR